MNNNTPVLETINNLISFIDNNTNNDEQKQDTQIFEKAVGCEKQTYITLTTKTWRADPGQVEKALEYAIKCGYRHIDCAAVYGNEKEIGKTLKKLFDNGVVQRKDLFITSKLWNTKHDPRDVIQACKQTLSDLGLKYLDLYLIHWPTYLNREGNHPSFPKTEDGSLDYGKHVPLEYTWAMMEEIVEKGLSLHIGISNFHPMQVQRIALYSTIKPVINQCESHPYLTQIPLIKCGKSLGITFEVYSPLGNPGRPPKWDHTLPAIMKNKIVGGIAEECGVSPAAVCIRFQVQRGTVCLVKSVTPARIKSNLEVWNFKLSNEQMNALYSLNAGVRYGIPTVLIDGKRYARDVAHPEFPWKDDYEDIPGKESSNQ